MKLVRTLRPQKGAKIERKRKEIAAQKLKNIANGGGQQEWLVH